MRPTRVLVLAAVAVVALLMAAISPASAAPDAAASPQGRSQGAGDYIVVLEDSVRDPRAVASEHARTQGARVKFVYEHALKGYAATFSEQGLRGVQRDPRVDYVEADGVATIVHHICGHTKPAPYTGECAATYTVSGTVTDSSGGGPIGGASVSVDGTSATTGTDGSYSISGLTTGDNKPVTVSATGYETLNTTINVQGDTQNANFALTASSTGGGGGGTCSGGQTLPWGIGKIGADTSSTKADDCTGTISNVHVYVIDTGADTAHPDLNVVGHVNFAGGPNKDCNGHGTHVAGTIAAKDDNQGVVGVAPGAPITGVKVLGCSGSGSWSGVIAGIDWVTGNAIKPAIANMSLGGGAYNAIDQAVRNSAASGVLYSIAAGNSGADACNSSPARAGAGTNNGIVTVAATNSNDIEASWSNYGDCVDIWAPGVSILSTYTGGGTATMSGTSMAAPHVGGGGALYLSSHEAATPSAVEAALKSAATTTGTTSKDGRAITRLFVGTF